ncbi:MAG: hypoxanthine phosphoribosyltransferase [Oligoflexus sp.]|jgi:hypoxanthine phosphoribosyltransferase
MLSQPSMKPLIPASKLQERVRELGRIISSDYKGRTLYVVGVLKGSFMFLADLVRSLTIDCQVEFIGVASYEGMHSTGHVRITNDLTLDIEGKDVLLVEDIIDTGTTIDYLLRTFQVRAPRSLKVCCLLSKPEAHQVKIDIDYTGFEIGKEFVIGYGLDLDGRFRNLPDLMLVTALDGQPIA